MSNWTNKYIPWLAITIILSISLAHFGIAYSSNPTKKVEQTMFNKNKTSLVKPTHALPTDLGHLFEPEEGSIEIPTKRTAHSKLYKEPKGSSVQEFYPKSIYYQNDTAQWVPVDFQLIPTTQAPFVVKNKANRFDAFFGDEGEFRFQEQENFLDIWPMNPFPSVGSVTGNKITFHNVYPNTDIQFTSDNDGVKEQIILQKLSAPYTFIFGANTQGLQLKKDDKSASLTVVDDKENAVAYFTDLVITDAQNKSIGQVALETQNSNGKTQLVISIDPKSLKDSSVHYPIKINLTLAKNGEDVDSSNSNDYPAIDSNIPGQSFTQYVLTNVPSGLSYTSLSTSLFRFADKLLQQEKTINQDLNVDETSLMSAWNLANRINDSEANIKHQTSKQPDASTVVC